MRSATAIPRQLVVRDLALLALTVLTWRLDERLHAAGGAFAIVAAILAGVLTAAVGFLTHEWGHLSASLLTGSVVSYPRSIFSSLLFHFESERNDRRQFYWMSAGGYLASIVGMLLIVAFVPHRLSGYIAIGLAALGALATFVLEVPITLRVMRGASLPTGSAYRAHD
jgi:hypothetical protein